MESVITATNTFSDIYFNIYCLKLIKIIKVYVNLIKNILSEYSRVEPSPDVHCW